mmetsp:Transcript_13072/g.15867  ORF Transcript_13072/g.15867 Transcript_13072/m.15867 type:complete len:349 (+) Transcript_13072:12-1058(+)
MIADSEVSAIVEALASEVDIIGTAKKQVNFLERIHPFICGSSFTLEALEYSLFRYIKLWLPLVLTAPVNTVLVPPVDIAWFWHSHRLCPLQYSRACWIISGQAGDWENAEPEQKLKVLKLFERPESVFLFSTPEDEDELTDSLVKTVEAWNSAYGNSHSFYFKEEELLPENRLPNAFTYDLINSSGNQREFLWQVSRECFTEEPFLMRAAFDYARFLHLIACSPGKFTVPRYDIDLMWHSHMTSSPYLYSCHSERFVRRTVFHDHSSTDRSPKSKLSTSWEETKSRWKEKYNVEYVKPEEMIFYGYRGPPDSHYWTGRWVYEYKSPGGVKRFVSKVSDILNPILSWMF